MVLRRSTTLCTCPRAFSSAARSIVSFIQVLSKRSAHSPERDGDGTRKIRRNRAGRKS